jgi:hypothetical protein
MPPSVCVLRAFVSLLEKRFTDVIQDMAAFLHALHAPCPQPRSNSALVLAMIFQAIHENSTPSRLEMTREFLLNQVRGDPVCVGTSWVMERSEK